MCDRAAPPTSPSRLTGSGGLDIEDTAANTSAFTGLVSGFGGANHTNHKQFIDLVDVTSAGTITSTFASAGGTAKLTVLSNSTPVASIEFVGAYSAGNFHITAGISGTVEIVDPVVPNGGSVAPGSAGSFPRDGIDLPNIAFGAQTTLAYAENSANTHGELTVTDGRHAASIVLLGNYMAGKLRH